LRVHALLSGDVEATHLDVAEAHGVREALRAMGRRNNGIPCDCDAACLEAAAERSRLVLAFDADGGSALRPSSNGVDGALGNLLAAVYRSMLDRSWLRLKVCADDGCAWAYYDHSKNGCSRWCSAEGCGNRNKVKRFRERRALGTGASAE
jgi:predicted RNA-binding Zn ribbon-like protein